MDLGRVVTGGGSLSGMVPVGKVPSTIEVESIMKNLFKRFVKDEQGQDLIEYAFLAVFIGLAVTLGLTAVATGINTQMSNIGSTVGGS